MAGVIKGQFHHHFMSSFYARRSCNRKKDSQIMQLFVLLEPAHIKAVRKHIVEIDPRNFLTDASDRDKRKQIKKYSWRT